MRRADHRHNFSDLCPPLRSANTLFLHRRSCKQSHRPTQAAPFEKKAPISTVQPCLLGRITPPPALKNTRIFRKWWPLHSSGVTRNSSPSCWQTVKSFGNLCPFQRLAFVKVGAVCLTLDCSRLPYFRGCARWQLQGAAVAVRGVLGLRVQRP